MGFRFQRRFKLFPGVSINLSKSGVSTSVGVRGARVNFRGNKTTTTVGVPGSGMSYREQATDRSGSSALGTLIVVIAILVAVAWLF